MKEHDRAKAWMESLGLDRKRLAELTGYTEQSIYWYLRGETPPDSQRQRGEIKPWVWKRFKLTCAAVDAEIRGGTRFDW